MDQTFAGFGWQARFVAIGAAAAAAAMAYVALVPSASAGVVSLTAALVVTVAALILLTRTPMPTHLRTGLMLSLIVAVLCLALKADFVLVTPVQRSLDKAVSTEPEWRIANADGSSRRVAGGPAQVNIRGFENTPFSTVTGLGSNFAADIPGAAAWRISGDATPYNDGDHVGMAIDWRVSGLGGDIDCGTMSVTAVDPATALAAIRERLRRAIRNSIRDNHARCA